MKHGTLFSSLLLLALSLVLAPTALASNTWYADGVNGNDSNNCSSATTACKTIGHAISLAISGDTIRVAAANYIENVSIAIGLNLIGAGAKTTKITGISPFPTTRALTISTANAHVTVRGFSIHAENSGGVYNSGNLTIDHSTVSGSIQYCASGSCSSASGGGIYNDGKLTIRSSTISGNSAYTNCAFCGSSGGGIDNEGELTICCSTLANNVAEAANEKGVAIGGGIYNGGKLTISNTSITDNVTEGLYSGLGGGVYNGGTLIVSNSTFSGNSAKGTQSTTQGWGGGIDNSGTVTIGNSTLSGNDASSGQGGDILNSAGTITSQNSIVAGSGAAGNCSGTITSNGYNLSSDGTCKFGGPGDMNSTDPKLGALQNNGGPTRTMALLQGSPAIDAGNPRGCTDSTGHLLKTDQRGEPRPDKEDKSGCDMGAYERQGD
jgi:hypothetical protein